jgi:predicted nucleic acid-binding protein
MNIDAVEDEVLSPADLRDKLQRCGLVIVEITIEEFYLAEEYGLNYPRLSLHDRIALAIAKERRIPLLTGDGALRKAGVKEKVSVLGTLGILDQLNAGKHIDVSEYKHILLELKKRNGLEIRLPKNEIQLRLERLE